MSEHTPLPWHTGCLCNDNSSCNCAYIFSEGYQGGIGEVFIDNGKNISDGGSDCPSFDEAKANLAFIVEACNNYETIKTQRDTAVEALKAVVEGCKTLKMVSKGAGGMTIEAQTRRSVYHNVPAWPIECASYALDEIGEL